MPSTFGKNIKMTILGKSHDNAVGIVMHGMPTGQKIDREALKSFMRRRSPGKDTTSSARQETDTPLFLTGLDGNRITNSTVTAIILNTDVRSGDYENIADTPRPGHADMTAYLKWHGRADMRGGGAFSGRMTAPMCIAGGIAKQILEKMGVFIGAHLLEAGGVRDEEFPLIPKQELFADIAQKALPVINDAAGEEMRAVIHSVSESGDSVGGIIECAVTGVRAGIGNALFDGIESAIASAIFAIPAVKGIEFGAGFASAGMFGSENNDDFAVNDGEIVTTTNNCGGILGGISDGMPIVFKTAIKPTPSILKIQKTVRMSDLTETKISVTGRHDPCIAPRAVPVVEAMTAFTLLDIIIGENSK